MVSTIQATQAREGMDTTADQASRADYGVNEAERATFFELERFKGGKRGETDQRHEMFVRALRNEAPEVRHDVARSDFSTIDGHPLAFERVAIVAPMFREHAALDPGWAEAKLGAHTSEDERLVRFWWEVSEVTARADLRYAP